MISRALLRDLIIMIIVTKFETNLKTYVEIKRYLVQLHIIYFVQTTKVFKQSFTHCINRFQYSFIIIYMSEMKEYWNLPFGTLGRPLVL